MDSHFLSGKHIVVAGAGPAGLAFVLTLRKLWPSGVEPPRVTIYERDVRDSTAGREGYSMSVSGFDETGGLFTFKKLELLDRILDHAILGVGDTGSFKVWNASWKELMSVRFKPAKGLPTSGIRIARKELHQALLDGVGANEIHWGVACVTTEKLPNGRMKVQLSGSLPAEQTMVECDLLIAADGTSSKLRKCLRPDDTLQYAGALQLGGHGVFPKGVPKPVDENWGMVLSGKGVACFVSPSDKTSVVWGLSILTPNEEPPLDHDDPAQVRSVIEDGKKYGSVFDEPFQTIVDATDPKTTFRLSARDKAAFGHDVKNGAVVFIGDSNHAVSPFAGYGINLALKDGWDLAEQICKSSSLSEALKVYDSLSIPRANFIRKISHDRIKMSHSTGLKYVYHRALLGIGGYVMWIRGRS